MSSEYAAIDELRLAVERAPSDGFHRCNLACALAEAGAVEDALLHLAAAVSLAYSPIAAGCAAGAIRDVADGLARIWDLPIHGAEPTSPPPPPPADVVA